MHLSRDAWSALLTGTRCNNVTSSSRSVAPLHGHAAQRAPRPEMPPEANIVGPLGLTLFSPAAPSNPGLCAPECGTFQAELGTGTGSEKT
jgi:hypothetical protein